MIAGTHSLSERLRTETHGVHMELERAILPYIQRIENTNDYVRLLKLFYGFFAPLEVVIMAYDPTEIISDFSKRRKAAALEQDIRALNSTIMDCPICKELPPLETTPQVAGAMYVMEGSTLGGRAIAGIIRKRLPSTQVPFGFFLHYGDNTNVMWETFREQLNRYQPEAADEIITSAEATFISFKNWANDQSKYKL